MALSLQAGRCGNGSHCKGGFLLRNFDGFARTIGMGGQRLQGEGGVSRRGVLRAFIRGFFFNNEETVYMEDFNMYSRHEDEEGISMYGGDALIYPNQRNAAYSLLCGDCSRRRPWRFDHRKRPM